MEDKREVSKSIGNDKAMLYNCAFMETSALSAENVEKAFKLMINEIFNKFHKKLNENTDNSKLSGGQRLVSTDEIKKPTGENSMKCCKNT